MSRIFSGGQFRSESDRIASIVVLVCMTIVAVGCLLGMSYLFEYNFYEKGDNGQTAKSIAVQLYSLDDSEFAKDYFKCVENNTDSHRINYYKDRFSLENSSYIFTVCDVRGETVFDSVAYSQSGSTYAETSEMAEYTGTSDFYHFDGKGLMIPLRINYAVLTGDSAQANDKYTNAFTWIEIANSLRYFLFVALFIAVLIIVILLSAITVNAGMKDIENGEIVPGFVDKIPLDICTLFLLALFCVAWMVFGLTSAADVGMVLNNVVVMITCMALILILMTYLTTLSVRVKMGKIYKNTVIYQIYRKFKRKTPRKIRRTFGEMSVFKKLILGIAAFVLFEAAILSVMGYLGILSDNHQPRTVLILFIIVWAMTRLIIIPIFAMIAVNLHYVKEEGQKLAQGVLGDGISSKLTIASIRAHGKNLDSIRKEINKAMEQELKSEKLKSELIANVSHDIKTPITSIKNYVDFLGREDITDEERKGYLEIINKHTDKLSLLLNDIIEASQISSGSIDINLEKTSLNIVIEQTVEEFATKLEQSELIPRIEIPQDDVYIMGDGKWLWRIFANLFNNACKYSAPGTDVKVALDCADGKATVQIANLSQTELDIEGDELFERFVRGDSSRHTEGNGLGLSIAKSLTELQGGEMNIRVEDNMFIAVLTFDITE